MRLLVQQLLLLVRMLERRAAERATPLRRPGVQGELLLPLRFLRRLCRLSRCMEARQLLDEAQVEGSAAASCAVVHAARARAAEWR
jgi:hypothetical protein